jgi:ArsR family transcriptional regulator, lead/cadmium/zinc/bismuth-responsive transcriptional repressor
MTIEQNGLNKQRVKIFKALSDPTRLEVVKILASQSKEWRCGEIGTEVNSSKSNSSYHFRAMEEAGLIRIRKVGQVKYVSLNRETFDKFLPGFLETL